VHDDLVRIVVVTGGNRGIGADITRAFSAAGWRVVIGSRSAGGRVVWTHRRMGELCRILSVATCR